MVTNLNLTDMETCYKVFRARRHQAHPDPVEPLRRRAGAHRQGRATRLPRSTRCRSRTPAATYWEGKKIRWTDGVVALWTILRYAFVDDRRTPSPATRRSSGWRGPSGTTAGCSDSFALARRGSASSRSAPGSGASRATSSAASSSWRPTSNPRYLDILREHVRAAPRRAGRAARSRLRRRSRRLRATRSTRSSASTCSSTSRTTRRAPPPARPAGAGRPRRDLRARRAEPLRNDGPGRRTLPPIQRARSSDEDGGRRVRRSRDSGYQNQFGTHRLVAELARSPPRRMPSAAIVDLRPAGAVPARIRVDSSRRSD